MTKFGIKHNIQIGIKYNMKSVIMRIKRKMIFMVKNKLVIFTLRQSKSIPFNYFMFTCDHTLLGNFSGYSVTKNSLPHKL